MKNVRRGKSFENVKSILNQRIFMDELFNKLQLKSLDDWQQISKNLISQNGGKALIKYYSGDLQLLLSNIYPNHQFTLQNPSKNGYFRSIKNQREYMDKLYTKLELKSLDEWLKVKKNVFIENGGQSLLKYYYKNKLKSLYQEIYPNYSWDFTEILTKSEYFSSLSNQKKFMENLFQKLQLKSIDDWRIISRDLILVNGGKSLLRKYSQDVKKLLKTIFPEHKWEENELIITSSKFTYFRKLNNQIEFMNYLFKKLKLKSIDDWLNINRTIIIKNGGRILVQEIYENDMKKLLTTIFSNHQFDFAKLSGTNEFKLNKLNKLIEKYAIRRKEEWYRIPLIEEELHIKNVYKFISNFYPNEKFSRSLFYSRSKKSAQRKLFLFIQKIYTNFILIENYHHPYLLLFDDRNLEFDIFIPNLNLAFEYQGAQHYDEFPSVFSHIQTYKNNDLFKQILVKKYSFNLITIPYWWINSPFSLLSIINDQFVNVKKN